ncbi:MAG TPA: hypothetical protein V6C85_39175 [Allocoleopsis sp.]
MSTFVYCVKAIAMLESHGGSVPEVGGELRDRDRPFGSFLLVDGMDDARKKPHRDVSFDLRSCLPQRKQRTC